MIFVFGFFPEKNSQIFWGFFWNFPGKFRAFNFQGFFSEFVYFWIFLKKIRVITLFRGFFGGFVYFWDFPGKASIAKNETFMNDFHTLCLNFFFVSLQNGQITRERILVLFFFCSDVAILAIRRRASQLVAELTQWSLHFIRNQVRLFLSSLLIFPSQITHYFT